MAKRIYVSDNAQLMAEWDWEKNNELGLDPSKTACGSGKNVWWKCKNEHSWKCTPNARTTKNGTGCPYCSNHRVFAGYNDLCTLRPDLAKEWHPSKNKEICPTQVSAGSKKKVWWICKNGHEYQASIANRKTGYGCPYCSGRYPIKGQNDLLTVNPSLAKDWNHKRNNGLTPADVLPYSDKKVWWICEKGHEWQTQIKIRTKGNGCPYCSERLAVEGVNDLKTLNPTLAQEWNYEKNGKLRPENMRPNSGKKIWWKCSQGHEWQQTVDKRNNGVGCPYCSNHKLLKGYNDLATTNPALVAEWNYEKNGNLTPEDLIAGNEQKVWWKCSQGHEWQTPVKSRASGSGCPYCAGRKVLRGFNDLATTNPDLASEWNYEKNKNLTPQDVTKGSDRKVWWRCSEGHEWQATVANRNYENNCPICQNKKILVGYNDLTTINPTLASEWNYKRNGSLMPENFAESSGKKVWWKCKKGHEWQATIASRNSGTGCPICNSERHTSFPEFALVYYFKKYGVDIIHSYKDLGYELDVYIPSQKIAIEYDGSYWHKDKTEKELKKNARCKADGIMLYRIRQGLPSLNDSSIDYLVDKYQKNLEVVLKKVLSIITKTDVDVDLDRDSIEIENLREYAEKRNSILFSQPEIAKEWNYEKNGNLKPEHVTANSTKNVWWKCVRGHEWQTTIVSRTHGNKCPYCSNRLVKQNYNDLQTDNPFLAKEWNYEKNGGLVPTDVKANSDKKVWWKCANEHEWQATIGSRNSGGHKCPYCSGRYAIKGVNDLQTVNPTLAKEWNYDKNNGLTPADVLPNSEKKVWWKCQEGHEWQTLVKDRTRGSGCPYCSGKKVLPGYNDLATLKPDIALEWHPTKNGDLTPNMVSCGSNKNIWWLCKCGREWQAKVYTRGNTSGCPECAKQKRKKKDI